MAVTSTRERSQVPTFKLDPEIFFLYDFGELGFGVSWFHKRKKNIIRDFIRESFVLEIAGLNSSV